MIISYKSLFSLAMGKEIGPYPYQVGLAEEPWPDIVNIETGMGKTAGIILAWLFKRLVNDPETPRRLVYCLPMRVLVEQTALNADNWIKNLADSNIFPPNRRPSVYALMGGEVDKDWDRYPEREAILIGTQDQLLSRSLNRGYAVSRFRWPVQFGLLNNECLWVADEIQLMGSGLATTTQMEAFRNTLGTALPVRSIWMSATLQRNWLRTVDFTDPDESLRELTLSEEDKDNPSVKTLIRAKKPQKRAECPFDKPNKIAGMVLDVHKQGTRTLVVVNTVKRAVDIYNAVKRKKPKPELILVHSRFRSGDRGKALDRMLATPDIEGSICISTQVVEAGVDVSATTLITDLAPWPSLVQRFGRCNRYGLDNNGKVIWLDIDTNKKGASLPYTESELDQARSTLLGIKDASPWKLPDVSSEVEHKHVLRRKDIIDLFGTTPDLAGMDIDISRFIRESDDHDVHVFWRDIHGKDRPSNDEPSTSREELCSVPVNDLKAAGGPDIWRWDHLEKGWFRPISIPPGSVLMLRTSDGGYSAELGWTGDKSDIPEPVEVGDQTEEANDDDRYASVGWQTLAEHTEAVVEEIKNILADCKLPEEAWEDILVLAARWHDAGKAHEIFQTAMVGDRQEADASVVWAKTGRGSVVYGRKGFRHELASALAMLQNGMPDLAVYLAAAHHGKVRLSIRSTPHEISPPDPAIRFARGIWEGDVLREADLGGGQLLPQTALELSYVEFGDGPLGPSWLSRMLSLRDDPSLGPFRMAYLEALLRTADWRASEKVGNTTDE